jgi:hypothetical protein
MESASFRYKSTGRKKYLIRVENTQFYEPGANSDNVFIKLKHRVETSRFSLATIELM